MADDKKKNANLMRFNAAVSKANKKPIRSHSSRKPALKKHITGPIDNRPKKKEFIGTVLIIDPDLRLTKILAGQIKLLRLDPVITPNAMEALMLIEVEMPDLIIIEKELPDMKGLTCCSRIRAMNGGGEIPILIATQKPDQQTKDGALMVEATDVIEKPYNVTKLLSEIRILVNLPKLQKESREKELESDLIDIEIEGTTIRKEAVDGTKKVSVLVFTDNDGKNSLLKLPAQFRNEEDITEDTFIGKKVRFSGKGEIKQEKFTEIIIRILDSITPC